MSDKQRIKTKSLGLAIVLTLFFGPFGLFYATIRGGLLMILTPFVLSIAFFMGLLSDNSFLLAGSIVLLLVFGISYWIICVIWAATAVSNFNSKALNDARQAELLNQLTVNKQQETKAFRNNVSTNVSEKAVNSDAERPSLQEWRKQNPDNAINDYYKRYGIPQATSTSFKQLAYSDDKAEDSKSYAIYIVSGFTVLLIVALVLFYDKTTQSISLTKFNNTIGISNDNKEIEMQIENVYFGVMNGAYTAQSLSGTTPENLPFYNADLTTLLIMGFAPLTLLSGDISLEPKNIEILKIYDDKADVSYDLVFNEGGAVTTKRIEMTLKKIGGNWKLDGQSFLPFEEN